MAKYAFVENRSTSSKSGLKNSLSGENKFGKQAVTTSWKVIRDPEGFKNLRGPGLRGYSSNSAFIFTNSNRDMGRMSLSYGGTNMQLRSS